MNSLRSKLANKKVKGVFWPVVKSLWGVWAFFPNNNDKIFDNGMNDIRTKGQLMVD